jgi:hypothetical protein
MRMKLEYMIRILAGTLILVSLVLSRTVSEWWLLLGAFVGINLIQSSFTRFCPAEKILSRMTGR